MKLQNLHPALENETSVPVCQTLLSARRPPPRKPKVRKVIIRGGCCAMALAEYKQ